MGIFQPKWLSLDRQCSLLLFVAASTRCKSLAFFSWVEELQDHSDLLKKEVPYVHNLCSHVS